MSINRVEIEEIEDVSAGLSVSLNIISADRTVDAPEAATKGAINAFTHILQNGVEIDNLDVSVNP